MTFCDVIARGWVWTKDAGYEIVASRRASCFRKSSVAVVFIQNVCVVKGDRIKVRGEEVRIYIIVVIVVDREMFRNLTRFLLRSLGGQIYICEFVSSHRSQRTYTEQNFHHCWSMKKTNVIVLVKKLKEAAVLVKVSLSEAKALVKVHSKNSKNKGIAMPVYCRRSLNSSPKSANIWLLASAYESGVAFHCCWKGSGKSALQGHEI